ncbi:unnamed protein product [Ilex paraguariensis]|uniref:Uncharacterized protein n=1 Tax=Ilex paraguariensis TaxID=185542 RepID=A0ABC8TXY5_9AQUA
MMKVLEDCRVAPPPGTVAGKSLPLTFFDLPWLHFPLIHRVMFYEFPHSKTHFIESVIPKLKHSASLTLKHFFPLAGNLIVPSNSSKPEMRYVNGDSVSLIFAESRGDFDYLSGDHARNADEFHPLVPQMPEVIYESGTAIAPLLALQVTLFPDVGLCFGLIFHHVIADASTLMNFLNSWASIFKSGGDEDLLKDGILPLYERSVIKDPKGLEEIYWGQLKDTKFEVPPYQFLPTNKVRATFVMRREVIQKLKKLVSDQRPSLSYVSTVTTTCAFVWICMVKSRLGNGEDIGEDDWDLFVLNVDCRARWNPPLPVNYFGNCITPIFIKGKSTQLIGDEGFLTAAGLIGEGIHNRLHNEEGVMKDMENWVSEFQALVSELLRKQTIDRAAGVAGSPKLGFYGVDFGWGRPKKIEIISIDVNGAFSVMESRDSEGGVEVGVSLPKIKLDAFVTIFEDSLQNI